MRNPVETVDSYVIGECMRIAHDESETPERRRKAEKWLHRLLQSPGSNWGNDGKTVAEKVGIEVDPKAPGGQRVDSPGNYGGRVETNAPDIDSGELSSELHSGMRTTHRARERHHG